jgi:CheY-like chemotaxis protein
MLEPDVAVLELRMPGLDGLEVCDILRGLDRGVSTQLVLISGEANDTLAVAARSLGVVALLNKDSARHDLCERLVQIADGSA